jgi:cardiolipin synthase
LQIGILGLWGAAILTLITGYDYLRAGLRQIHGVDAARSDKAPEKTDKSSKVG